LPQNTLNIAQTHRYALPIIHQDLRKNSEAFAKKLRCLNNVRSQRIQIESIS